MKTIYLDFDGYWLEDDKTDVPGVSGVYCVYAGKYLAEANRVGLRELIYIGESGNVRDRLANHERLRDWTRQLRTGETLCYAVAKVNSGDRERAEAAVVYRHKPPCNVEYISRFPFDSTHIEISGRNCFRETAFTVYTKR
jgi:excinuclease UvrABC nuclease subunit